MNDCGELCPDAERFRETGSVLFCSKNQKSPKTTLILGEKRWNLGEKHAIIIPHILASPILPNNLGENRLLGRKMSYEIV